MLITTSKNGLKIYNSENTSCEASKLTPNLWPNIMGYENVNKPISRNQVGPLSIKYILKGKEIFELDGRSKVVDKSSFLIVNNNQKYTSSIEDSSVESMSIFFNTEFVTNTLNSMLSSDRQLLEGETTSFDRPIDFFQNLYRHGGPLSWTLFQIAESLKEKLDDANYYNYAFYDLFERMVMMHGNIIRRIQKLPLLKPSTKIEIFKRVQVAKDFIESNYADDINLDLVAKEACLSKFYFLRSFKMVLGETPHHYLVRKRVNTAKELLESTDLPIIDIANLSGFQDPNTFNKVFRKYYLINPSQYRKLSKS